MRETAERERRDVERTDARHSAERRGLLVIPPARLVIILVLLVASSVAWRRGTYYEGGADLVVVAKAALTCLALLLSLTTPRERTWSTLRATPSLWLAAYLVLAGVSGAIAGTETIAALVLVARLAILATVLLLVAATYEWRETISALVVAMLGVAIIAVSTGISNIATGRLEGGVPPLSPNALSMLIGVPLLAVAWECLSGAPRWPHLAAVPILSGLVWATGSRTGFASLLLAVLLIALTVKRVSLPAFATAVLAVPVVLFVAGWTTVLSGFLVREDGGGLTTLNSRTVAWSAALDYADTFTERMLGAGLTLKQIPVSAMYRDEQILDSSWISALLQVGFIGTALLAVFVGVVFVAVCRSARPQRPLFLAIIVYLAIVSVLESGLFDASVAFIAFFTIALYTHTTKHEGGELS